MRELQLDNLAMSIVTDCTKPRLMRELQPLSFGLSVLLNCTKPRLMRELQRDAGR